DGRHDLFVQREVRCHHADYRKALIVQDERLPDDIWVGTEAALPEAVTEDDRRRLALLILFRQEDAAKQRLRVEEREERRRDARAFDVFGGATACEVEAAAERRRDMLEDMVFSFDVEVLPRRKPILHDVQ